MVDNIWEFKDGRGTIGIQGSSERNERFYRIEQTLFKILDLIAETYSEDDRRVMQYRLEQIKAGLTSGD